MGTAFPKARRELEPGQVQTKDNKLKGPMKRTAAIVAIMTLASGALGQGLVNFANNSTTLISIMSSPIPTGMGGFFWFALMAAPSGTTDYFSSAWYNTGVSATNVNSAAGRITGGVGLTVNNWAAGQAKAFFVVGWSADNGTTLNPAWLLPGNVYTGHGNFAGPPQGYFGVSAIAPAGIAGGGPTGIPNLNIFGGTQGIQEGFAFLIPEPTSVGSFAIGFGALWALRFRKHTGK